MSGVGTDASRPTARTSPPSLAQRPWRYAAFFSTYLYQGLVAGFSLTALANHYSGRGVSASEVGLHFALAGLPWTVQPVLWGPLVDRVGPGRRRICALTAIAGSHLALCGLFLVPDAGAIGAVGLVLFAHSLAASLLDTACDRMVMDHVPPDELGRMSACMRIGFVVGTSLSAAVFAWTLSVWPFADSIALLLGLGLAATILPVVVRERPGDALFSLKRHPGLPPARASTFRRFLRRLALGLRRGAVLRILLLCFGLDFVLALFEVRFGVDLVQGQGWDAATLSRLQAGLAFVGGTAGALAIGLWSDRVGRLPALRLLLVASALAFALAGLLIAAGSLGAAAPVLVGLTNILPNLIIVAMVPALMEASRGRAGAATQFEVFMATMNLGSVAGAAASGFVGSLVPIAGVGLLVAFVFAVGAWLCDRRHFLAGKASRVGRTL
ncbi:MFS transporter [Methylobacterium iners]|uniref:Major facilitator superfamily (MFS) profile domain-containing protein n=1 Tax=Methylobacterium iners TaxID=418707 RepID=A0ABQ4RWS6_9HYPH|nr:MFS transporter [Methylobacterium iners]GJD95303.1 hypothetical protein OCOJLMKI_2514 [Methylobacterium iners]